MLEDKKYIQRCDTIVTSLYQKRMVSSDTIHGYELIKEAGIRSCRISITFNTGIGNQLVNKDKIRSYIRHALSDGSKKTHVGDFLLWLNLLPKQVHLGSSMLFITKRMLQKALTLFIYKTCKNITTEYSVECSRLLGYNTYYTLLNYYNQISSRYRTEKWAMEVYNEFEWIMNFMANLQIETLEEKGNRLYLTLFTNIYLPVKESTEDRNNVNSVDKQVSKPGLFTLASIKKMFKRKNNDN